MIDLTKQSLPALFNPLNDMIEIMLLHSLIHQRKTQVPVKIRNKANRREPSQPILESSRHMLRAHCLRFSQINPQARSKRKLMHDIRH